MSLEITIINIDVNRTMTKRDAFLLFLAVGIIIGYTYSVDIPQALEVPLRKPPYNFTTVEFNLLYFSTFVLIGFLQVPFGVFVDRYPIKRTLLALLIILCLSQTVIGLMFEFRPAGYLIGIMAMRSIFGLCGEGLYTIQCVVMSIFAEGEYEFLASIAMALPFAFDSINSVITTAVYDTTQNLPLTWYIGSVVCLVSFGCGVWMNKSIIGKENQDRNEALGNEQSCMKEIRVLSSKFWVIIGAIFFTEASLGSFNDNLNQFIVSRFSFSYTDTGKLLLIPYIGMAILTTIIGFTLRQRPHLRRLSIVISTFLYLIAQTILYILPNSKDPQVYHYLLVIFFLFSMSFNFAVYYASLTTSIPFLVSQSVLGTAWGCAGSAIGFSQCFIPLFFTLIIESDPDIAIGYRNLNIAGIAFAAVPVGFAIWINYWDYDELDSAYIESQGYKTHKEYSEVDKEQKGGLEESILTQEELKSAE